MFLKASLTGVSFSSHPEYPDADYCNNVQCKYYLRAESPFSVQLSFDELTLADGDTLSIYEGNETNYNIWAKT